ncbi:hypothetical protein HLB23_34775 [Nocardia uniformis]|uniref:Uncharacterized protein n=1 Tax=Nocardia uniformis TaxID=53432 RepID=A0A849CEX3_9NOCA|nr:hypothetical protein [Nocardia uniformis]NNH74957.1 hypothetical protein [Nocardia uniformis]
MSDASVEVLLDDFENKSKWELVGVAARRAHLTTFVEGAPSKGLASFADGAMGRDIRALVVLIRKAADDLVVELASKPKPAFTVAGRLETLRLWVRSPHAAIRVYARLESEASGYQEVLLAKVPTGALWQHSEYQLDEPITDATLLGLKIRLMDVVKREGEVMILLDDLTVRTAG